MLRWTLLIIACGVLVACSSSDGSVTTGAPPSSSSPSPGTPSPAKEKEPAVRDAQLRGNFAMEFRATTASGPVAKGDRFNAVYRFDPRCAQGPCDVKASTDPSITFENEASSYRARETRGFGTTCDGEPISTAADFFLRVLRADEKDGRWVATDLSGVLRESVASQGGCDPVKVTWQVRGHLTNRSPTRGSGVPSFALKVPEPPCSVTVLKAAAGSKWPTGVYGKAAEGSRAYCADGWAAIPYASPGTGDPIAELFRWVDGRWVYRGGSYGTCSSLKSDGVPLDVARKILPPAFCDF